MRKVFCSTLSLLLLLVGASSAHSRTPNVKGADITQVGIFEFKISGNRRTPGTAAGTTHEGKYKFVSRTTTLAARKGVHFGFEYVLVGAPKGAMIDVRKVTIFPDRGVANPQTGKTWTRGERISTNFIGEHQFSGYGLDHYWEVVPGVWTLQVWYRDRKLAEQSFSLTKP
jgi:hypothetical protein